MADYRGRNILLYDGECPFCSSVSRYYAAEKAFPALEAYSMRDAQSLKTLELPPELDFNPGMILLKADGGILQGADAFQALNIAASDKSLRNKAFFGWARSSKIARLAYPIVYKTRELLLRARGINTDLPRVDRR